MNSGYFRRNVDGPFVVTAIWIVLLLGLAGVIIAGSFSPSGGSDSWDWVRHFSAYAFMAFLIVQIFNRPANQWLAIIAVLIMSLIVELLQPFAQRERSFIDLIFNLSGAGVGYIVSRNWSRPPLTSSLRKFLTALGLTVGALIVGAFGVGHILHGPFKEWDCAYPWEIGDEVEGGRAWQGELLCARLTILTRGEHDGSAGTLDCQRAASDQDAQGSLYFGAGSDSGGVQMQRQAAERQFCQTMRSADAFVLEAKLRSDERLQYGPARILTNSASPYLRNFSLSQAGGAFDVRVRTPSMGDNGKRIPLQTPRDAVTPGKVQDIVVTFDKAHLTIKLNGRTVAGPTKIDRLITVEAERLGFALSYLVGAWMVLVFACIAMHRGFHFFRKQQSPPQRGL